MPSNISDNRLVYRPIRSISNVYRFLLPNVCFPRWHNSDLEFKQRVGQSSYKAIGSFQMGSAHFAVLGVLIGAITILANLDEPKKLGPEVALALLTLFWATVFNYLCKLIIENKKLNERPSP